MAAIIKDWFCELCTLQFDKKVVFDLHQKLVHGIDSIRLIRVKEKRAQLCNTENSINTNDLTTANLDFTEVPTSTSTIESSSCLRPENLITTNNSTPFESRNDNILHDIWAPSHEKYASAACTTATIDITEVHESNTVESSPLVSESCQNSSTNLDITNFVSSITFDDEKNLDIKVEQNLDIKVELKHDPGITFIGHEDKFETNPGKANSVTSLKVFDQQRQNVKDNPPSNNLSRIEKLARLKTNFDLSNSPNREAPFATSVEIGQRQDVETNIFFSRIEVIQKLASMKIDFDLSKSLTDLQNLLRENLMKLKCKEPVTVSQSTSISSSLALEINPVQTKQINIESESDMSSLSVITETEPKKRCEGVDQNEYDSETTSNKVQCEYCREVYSIRGYENHIETCKVYCKYLIKISRGFQCSICSTVIRKNRMVFYNHMKIKHADISEESIVVKEVFQNENNAKKDSDKKEAIVTNNLSRIEVIEKLASMKINFDLNNSLKDLQNLLRENLVKQKCKEPVTASESTGSLLANKDGEFSTVSRCSGLDIIEVQPKVSESLNTKSDASNEVIDEVVEVGPEDISDTNPTGKVHPENFIEIKNLSRNEVIEKLASLNITFDLSMSLTDLKNRLGENLVKLKCKEPVTASQSTRYLLLAQERQSNKEIESTTTVSGPRNDLLSNSYKDYLSKKTEVNKKLASSVPSVNSSLSKKYTEDQYLEMVGKRKHGCLLASKNKVQGIAMKRNVSNTVETIDLDKSDSIPTKRGLMDEDVTCEHCSQAFWYKSQLYEHLEKEHDIYDPLKCIKLREDKKKLEKSQLRLKEKRASNVKVIDLDDTGQSKDLKYSMLYYKNGSLFCRSCSKCFKSKSDILSHIRICFPMKFKVPNDGEKRNTKTTKEIVVLDEEIGQLEKIAGSHEDSGEDTGDMGIKKTCEMDKVSLLKITENYVMLGLPYGWKKQCMKRKNTEYWYFYVINSDNKKFKSNAEVAKYLEKNPSVKCDLSVTNTNRPSIFDKLQKPNLVLKEHKNDQIEAISDEDNEISDEESETSDEESEISDEEIKTSDEEKVIWSFSAEESDEEVEQEDCSAKPKCLKPVGKQVHIFYGVSNNT